jgi:hypothetical protein
MENVSRRIPVDPPGSLASIRSADSLSSLSSQGSIELSKTPSKAAKAPPKEAGTSGSFPTPQNLEYEASYEDRINREISADMIEREVLVGGDRNDAGSRYALTKSGEVIEIPWSLSLESDQSPRDEKPVATAKQGQKKPIANSMSDRGEAIQSGASGKESGTSATRTGLTPVTPESEFYSNKKKKYCYEAVKCGAQLLACLVCCPCVYIVFLATELSGEGVGGSNYPSSGGSNYPSSGGSYYTSSAGNNASSSAENNASSSAENNVSSSAGNNTSGSTANYDYSTVGNYLPDSDEGIDYRYPVYNYYRYVGQQDAILNKKIREEAESRRYAGTNYYMPRYVEHSSEEGRREFAKGPFH